MTARPSRTCPTSDLPPPRGSLRRQDPRSTGSLTLIPNMGNSFVEPTMPILAKPLAPTVSSTVALTAAALTLESSARSFRSHTPPATTSLREEREATRREAREATRKREAGNASGTEGPMPTRPTPGWHCWVPRGTQPLRRLKAARRLIPQPPRQLTAVRRLCFPVQEFTICFRDLKTNLHPYPSSWRRLV